MVFIFSFSPLLCTGFALFSFLIFSYFNIIITTKQTLYTYTVYLLWVIQQKIETANVLLYLLCMANNSITDTYFLFPYTSFTIFLSFHFPFPRSFAALRFLISTTLHWSNNFETRQKVRLKCQVNRTLSPGIFWARLRIIKFAAYKEKRVRQQRQLRRW